MFAQALAQFQPHGLADLNKAALMNRVDSKFVLPISLLPVLLTQLKQHYTVLEIAGQRVFHYQNQYYDTADHLFYRHHHNGKLNRYKVRHRYYVETDTHFLEVKFKNNKKRTIKQRIKVPDHQYFYPEFVAEQCSHLPPSSAWQLAVQQHSGYQRIALANEASAERLTLDFNLWYENTKGNRFIQLPFVFIAELKQAKKSKQSPFYQLMSRYGISPISFSKYCIGQAMLYRHQLKTNQFNATLRYIDKLSQQSQHFH
jgi:hypothetical protein